MERNHKNHDSLLDANYFGSPIQSEVDDFLVVMAVVSKPHKRWPLLGPSHWIQKAEPGQEVTRANSRCVSLSQAYNHRWQRRMESLVCLFLLCHHPGREQLEDAMPLTHWLFLSCTLIARTPFLFCILLVRLHSLCIEHRLPWCDVQSSCTLAHGKMSYLVALKLDECYRGVAATVSSSTWGS